MFLYVNLNAYVRITSLQTLTTTVADKKVSVLFAFHSARTFTEYSLNAREMLTNV